MKTKIISCILSISLFVGQQFFPGLPKIKAEQQKTATQKEENIKASELHAKSAVLMDGESGRVLYEKNGYEVLPMASTTKIMTCIVVLENTKLKDKAKVSQKAASMPDVQLNIRAGESYYIEDLLYSLMLESHNDSAVCLAEHVGGSVEGFAKKMNQKAKEIGCKNTYYITPNGLDAKEGDKIHATTAADLATVMKYCITQSPKAEQFLKITRTDSYTFSDIKGKRTFSCRNHNAFLHMMDGALSGKTGFTGNAGYCYVGALKKDGKLLIVALLACGWPNHKTYKWSDTRKLMQYGLKEYEFHSFSEVALDDSRWNSLVVQEGQTAELEQKAMLPVKVCEKQSFVKQGLLLNKNETINVTYHINNDLKAPVRKGEIVGKIQYLVGRSVIREDEIISEETILKIDFLWCLKMTINQFFKA